MATSKKTAKPAKLKVRIGGVYKNGEGKKVEIVGRVRGGGKYDRGDGKYDFLGVVRNDYGPRSDSTMRFSKQGAAAFNVGDQYDLVLEIA